MELPKKIDHKPLKHLKHVPHEEMSEPRKLFYQHGHVEPIDEDD